MHLPTHPSALTPRCTSADLQVVANLRDPIGVLSGCFSVGPHASDARALRDKLIVLRERAQCWRARDRRALFHAADRLHQRALRSSPSAGTEALAVYWLLDAGESFEFALPLSVGCAATVAARPRLGPLQQAVQAGRPAGLLRVDGDLGALHEISAQGVGTPRLVARPVDRLHAEVVAHAARRDWDILLVAGRGEALDEVLAREPSRTGPAIVDARDLMAIDGPAWPVAARARVLRERPVVAARRLRALVARARDGDEAVVCGLDSARRSIDAGRLRTLFVGGPAHDRREAVEELLRTAAIAGVTVVTTTATLDALTVAGELDDPSPTRTAAPATCVVHPS